MLFRSTRNPLLALILATPHLSFLQHRSSSRHPPLPPHTTFYPHSLLTLSRPQLPRSPMRGTSRRRARSSWHVAHPRRAHLRSLRISARLRGTAIRPSCRLPRIAAKGRRHMGGRLLTASVEISSECNHVCSIRAFDAMPFCSDDVHATRECEARAPSR